MRRSTKKDSNHLSPNVNTSRRVAAVTPRRRLFVWGALLALLCAAALAPHAATPRAQGARKLRITTASGVRVRNEPDTGTDELARLPLGVVVEELERSQD